MLGFFCLFFVIVIPIMLRGKNKSDRYAARGAMWRLSHEHRPPVCYFRSFASDRTTATGYVLTEEQNLARVIDRIGIFVAIGEPTEKLPHLGAARFYVPDEEWRPKVTELLEKSRAVVLRIGDGSGLAWELAMATQMLRPEQILLLVPRDRKLYEDFCERYTSVFPIELPRIADWEGFRGFSYRLQTFPFAYRSDARNLHAVLFFDPDWTPNVGILPRLSIPWPHAADPFEVALQLALKKFFQNLQEPWTPPRVNRVGYFTLTCWGLILVILIWNITYFAIG